MVFPFLLFIIALARRRRPAAERDHLRLPRARRLHARLIFSVFGWFYPARIIRGVVLSLREKEFVEAARMTGASDFRIMRSHLLPHLVAPIIVYSTLIVASNIIAEAGLSFLGLGIEQPTASWGNLLAAAPQYYLTPAVADGLAGARDPAHDSGFQPARRRPARRVRPAGPDLDKGGEQTEEARGLANYPTCALVIGRTLVFFP